MEIPDFHYVQLYCDIPVKKQEIRTENSKLNSRIKGNSRITILTKKNATVSYSPEVRKWKIKENDDHSTFTVIPLVDSSYNKEIIANYVCEYDSTKNRLVFQKIEKGIPVIYDNYVIVEDDILVDKENLKFLPEK